MLRKITVVVLGVSVMLFSGCASQNKSRELENEPTSAQSQTNEDEQALAKLQIQNEKLLSETRRLVEAIEDLKLELKKEKVADEHNDSKNSKPDILMNERSRPYSILISSCQKQESVQKVLSEYQGIELEPYVVKVDLGENGSWWRILAGHYETREGAIIEKNKYGLSDKIVLKATDANNMDVYNSEDEVENNMSLLTKENVDPIF